MLSSFDFEWNVDYYVRVDDFHDDVSPSSESGTVSRKVKIFVQCYAEILDRGRLWDINTLVCDRG